MNEDIPRARSGSTCPLFRKDTSKVCHTCAWWTGLTWRDEKGAPQHKWHCAIVMAALTNVDVVKATAGTQAATESFRNEMVLRTPTQPMTPFPSHQAHMIGNDAAPQLIEAQ